MNNVEEKLKLDLKTYKQLKKMLKSTDEDFQIAVENIKNIEISSIATTLLAKHLVYGKRADFLAEFKERITLSLAGDQMPQDKNGREDRILDIDLSWESLFPKLKESPHLTDFDKELVEHEINELISETLKTLDYKFIKHIKIELKW